MISAACLLILSIFFALAVLNFLLAAKLNSELEIPTGPIPRLSVLIPARNEAENLTTLLPALLASKVQPAEIIVLDDGSDDGTELLARRILEKSQTPFRILKGSPWNVSLGMTGKNFACTQLAAAATGDVFLFSDADVIPSQHAIGKTISFLSRVKCAGMSALPRQITCGERERLTIPWIMQIPLITLLPLWFGWRTRFPSLQMANGQWLAVHRDRYEQVGGHRALGCEVVDDIALARRLADKRRYGIVPVFAGLNISVKMYSDWEAMREGFSKNLVRMYGGTRFNFSICLLMWIALYSFCFWGFLLNPFAAAVGAILILGIRILASLLFQESLRDLLSHSRSLFWLLNLGEYAVRMQGRVRWKDRDV